MSGDDFAYWLQGFFEIENPETLDERQTQIIKDHLAEVFKKETPNRNGGNSGTGHVRLCGSHNLIC